MGEKRKPQLIDLLTKRPSWGCFGQLTFAVLVLIVAAYLPYLFVLIVIGYVVVWYAAEKEEIAKEEAKKAKAKRKADPTVVPTPWLDD